MKGLENITRLSNIFPDGCMVTIMMSVKEGIIIIDVKNVTVQIGENETQS